MDRVRIWLFGDGSPADYVWSTVVFAVTLFSLIGLWDTYGTVTSSHQRLTAAVSAQDQARHDLTQAQTDLANTSNPTFIELEARRELGMIREGETPYAVANPPEVQPVNVASQPTPATPAPPKSLWDRIRELAPFTE